MPKILVHSSTSYCVMLVTIKISVHRVLEQRYTPTSRCMLLCSAIKAMCASSVTNMALHDAHKYNTGHSTLKTKKNVAPQITVGYGIRYGGGEGYYYFSIKRHYTYY
jgi:hypothetical protein